MSLYEDATIRDDTAAHDTNDDLIKMLDDVDANEIGYQGLTDAEGNRYDFLLSFKHGMKEVECECLYYDADEIESGAEVDDNGAFVCELSDRNLQSGLYRAPEGWSPPSAPGNWNPMINSLKGEPLFEEVNNSGG